MINVTEYVEFYQTKFETEVRVSVKFIGGLRLTLSFLIISLLMFVAFNSNFHINGINWFKFSVIQWMTILTRMTQNGMFFMINTSLNRVVLKMEKISGHVIFVFVFISHSVDHTDMELVLLYIIGRSIYHRYKV